MKRLPWEITTDMFLSVPEVLRLLHFVRGVEERGEHRSAEAEDEGRRASGDLDRLIIEVLLFSGLRTSEFCKLTLADTPAAHGGPMLILRGRSPDFQTVHIPERVGRLIADYVESIRPRFLPEDVAATDADQPLIFHERRRPYERTGLYRRVCRILTDAGLGERASVQLLRHTYGYLAYLQTGGNLLFVQRQLGHAHPMITSVYARLVPESYEAMAEQIDFPECRKVSLSLPESIQKKE